jgi:hypothetical protein
VYFFFSPGSVKSQTLINSIETISSYGNNAQVAQGVNKGSRTLITSSIANPNVIGTLNGLKAWKKGGV